MPKYWYKIYREKCSNCGRVILEERERFYYEELATKKTEWIPMCEDCYRRIKL